MIPQIPVGLAMTCVTLTLCPLGSVETLTVENTGGSESETRPAESVVVMNTGVDSVVSGESVIVLRDTEDWLLSCM